MTGTPLEGDWKAGAPITYVNADGETDIDGAILEIRAPHLLRSTFRPRWAEDVSGAPETIVEWKLEALGSLTRVTITHSGMSAGSAASEQTLAGWTHLLSALKTLLETGRPMPDS